MRDGIFRAFYATYGARRGVGIVSLRLIVNRKARGRGISAAFSTARNTYVYVTPGL